MRNKNMAQEKRNQLKLLNEQKDKIEDEIESIYKELMKPIGDDNKPVGVKGNLIDKEGFPRADIDIHAIRILRNKYVCLQTDHKNLMKSIESLLKEVMSLPYESPTGLSKPESKTSKNKLVAEKDTEDLIPILRVDTVDQGSPSADCGLCSGDIILKFGPLVFVKTITQREIMAEVVRIVGQNINGKIEIILERNLEQLRLELEPKEWEGRGFLGCKLAPL